MAADPQALAAALGATPPAGQFSPVPTPQAAPTGTPAAAPVTVKPANTLTTQPTKNPYMDPLIKAMNEEYAFSQDPSSDPRGAEISKDIDAQTKKRTEAQEALAISRRRQASAEEDAAKKMEQFATQMALRKEVAPQLKNTAQQMAPALAILMALGGKAMKLHGGAAMAGMTGALNGAMKGDKAEYDRQRQAWLDQVDLLKDQYAIWTKVYEMKIKAAGTGVQAEQDAIDAANTVIDADWKQLGKLGDTKKTFTAQMDKLAQLAAQEQAHYDQHVDREEARLQRMELAQERLGYGVGPSELVEEKLGIRLPTKQAEVVTNAAAAMGEASRLQEIVKSDPGIVGREGQVRQFIDRYVQSAREGRPIPSDAESGLDQKALIFAKSYAAYLVNYEKSLAGTGRGFTVALQQRFNTLMQQNQFNAEGMVALLDDQKREVANQVTRIAPKVNYKSLEEFGDDIVGRAAKPTNVESTKKKPLPSADKLKSYADAHFGGDVAKATAYLKSQGYQ